MAKSAFFSQQARKPSGWFGRWVMAGIFNIGNASLNQWVAEILCPRAHDGILDIGCGTGKLIADIASQVPDCRLEGVDFSDTMVAIARRNNKGAMAAGRVAIHKGDFDAMPLAPGTYTKICTVNTIYFWPDPGATARKMASLLKPGGMLVVGYEDKDQLNKRGLDPTVFRFYSQDQVETLFTTADPGLSVRTRSRARRKTVFNCSIAVKEMP